MNNMLKYTKMLLLFVLVLGLTSCDSEEETEYNLPGEWYTSEEIDFGAYTWGSLHCASYRPSCTAAAR